MLSAEEIVAQILIRNLDDRVKARIQRRARRNGRSMEAEAREMLTNAALAKEAPAVGFGSATVALFSGSGVYLDEPIKEIRGMKMQIPNFDEAKFNQD
jgi:antitoxin FitA